MPPKRRVTSVTTDEVTATSLNERIEATICRLHASGHFSHEQLARMFHLHEQAIDDILHGREWDDSYPQQSSGDDGGK